MKHTPGPWEVVITFSGNILIDTPRCRWSLGRLMSESDASLIAAAPELLEALQEAVTELEFLYSAYLAMDGKIQPKDALVLEHMQAAIAKATGDGE